MTLPRPRLLLLGLLAVLVAGLAGWQMSPPEAPAVLAVGGGVYAAPVLVPPDPAADRQRLAARPPFPTAPGQEAAPDFAPVPEVFQPQASSPFRLAGIVLGPAGPEAILVVEGGGVQRLRVGDILPDGRAVQAITANAIVIDDPAGPVTLRLFAQGGAGSLAVPPAVPAAPGGEVPPGMPPQGFAPPNGVAMPPEIVPPPGFVPPGTVPADGVPVPGQPWPTPDGTRPPGWPGAEAIPNRLPQRGPTARSSD